MATVEGQAALRSHTWFGDPGKNGFIARHHLRAMGLDSDQFDGRPVVGIASTWSEMTPCNANLRLLAEHVKRGVLQAGGLPLEFPVMSLSEPLLRPTSMLYRNLTAMELEEQIRAQPVDAVVLLTGCDKTTPAALMGAASADVPAILVASGPMLNGKFRGRDVGSGTDVWRITEDYRAGRIGAEDMVEFETCLNRSAGHCMTMGTASTMSCLAEALGMSLSGAAALPAPDARRAVLAERSGARATEMARSGPRPSEILTRAAFVNAVVVLAAIGGSTNAVLHLLSLAGRVNVPFSLDDVDAIGRRVPLLVDLMPAGRYLMEEFAYAGGVPALLHEVAELLDLDVPTVAGTTLREAVGRETNDREVIRPLSDPVQPAGSGIAVLRGNLAPDGAVIKVSAAAPHLLQHTGVALVFDSLADYTARVDDPGLEVDPTSVIVVRGVGPRGYPGMPEVGNLPIPARLLAAGVTDMVRISDARMSGTAFGAVVLHVAPEAAVGGPLALVRTGDLVRLDVEGRRLDMLVPDAEIARRAAEWAPPAARFSRGWVKLYVEHVLQASEGVDLDFLIGSSGSAPPNQAF